MKKALAGRRKTLLLAPALAFLGYEATGLLFVANTVDPSAAMVRLFNAVSAIIAGPGTITL